MTVCSEIHTKHINTVCGQNVEFVNVNSFLGIGQICRLGDSSSWLALEGSVASLPAALATVFR